MAFSEFSYFLSNHVLFAKDVGIVIDRGLSSRGERVIVLRAVVGDGGLSVRRQVLKQRYRIEEQDVNIRDWFIGKAIYARCRGMRGDGGGGGGVDGGTRTRRGDGVIDDCCAPDRNGTHDCFYGNGFFYRDS